MTNKKNPKNPEFFSCEFCDFECSNKKDFNRHLSTRKHEILTNPNKKNAKNALLFYCDCGKQYKHRSSLSTHKKNCKFENKISNEIVEQDVDYKSLLVKAMNQLEEQQEQMKRKDELMANMIDKIDKIGNTTNNNTNNFNINMFLNERCKNAINFSDFIERIEISHDDLENNAQLGFVNGITKIFMDNLKQLTLYERPIHCTDVKRETMYIKDADEWEKEQSKQKINNGT